MEVISNPYVSIEQKALVEEFLSNNQRRKYLLGINKLSRSILKLMDVDGIIDDFSRVQRSRKKEVLSIDEVPKGSLIVNCATGSPLTVKNRLDALGFESISYLEILKYSKLPLAPHPFMMDFAEDYENNYERYKKVYDSLADSLSKETFVKLLNFKISFDYKFMQDFTNNHEEQYFDQAILPDLKEMVFVDGGAYVGDTAEQLITHYPDFKKLYCIEPIAENLRIAKRELSEHKNIDFIECGLWDEKKELTFQEEKSFSTMYGNGEQKISVDTIDNLINEKVDYIKLDIEGAEQKALLGAKETIRKYKPILAVCIYHKAEDWYKVAEIVLRIHKDYQVYLRHYMEGIFESVLYFIPPK